MKTAAETNPDTPAVSTILVVDDEVLIRLAIVEELRSEGLMAVEAASPSGPQETRMYELEGKPRLRICKIASRSDAQVGETVEFTLRFDNVGEQPVSSVTIIDSLTTRLEYVEGSQNSSREAKFDTQENDGESLVLRWTLTEPLKVGEGGIIRFQCKVR